VRCGAVHGSTKGIPIQHQDSRSTVRTIAECMCRSTPWAALDPVKHFMIILLVQIGELYCGQWPKPATLLRDTIRMLGLRKHDYLLLPEVLLRLRIEKDSCKAKYPHRASTWGISLSEHLRRRKTRIGAVATEHAVIGTSATGRLFHTILGECRLKAFSQS
jgi:hypothetical protein